MRDALRLRWEGTTQEAKGQILKQWGEWADDPVAMAEGVTDLAQGKLKRYAGRPPCTASSGSVAKQPTSTTRRLMPHGRRWLTSSPATRNLGGPAD